MTAAVSNGSNLATSKEEVVRQLSEARDKPVSSYFPVKKKKEKASSTALAPRVRKQLSLLLWMQQASVAPFALSHASFSDLEKGKTGAA